MLFERIYKVGRCIGVDLVGENGSTSEFSIGGEVLGVEGMARVAWRYGHLKLKIDCCS